MQRFLSSVAAIVITEAAAVSSSASASAQASSPMQPASLDAGFVPKIFNRRAHVDGVRLIRVFTIAKYP